MGFTYFIADLHLTEERPDITALFLHFIANEASQADALYILGDLFEVWIGDDLDSPLHRQIATALSALSAKGVPVYFIHGNRDFLVGKRYAKRASMQLLDEHTVVELYGTPCLIMHGDTLCTMDLGYQEFRKKSRRKWWQCMMLSLPLWYRKRYAAKVRRISKEMQKEKSMEIMDVTPEEVLAQMSAYRVHTLIHGHTHRPNIHHFELQGTAAKRMVVGDWYTQGSMLKVSAGGAELITQDFLKS